MCDFKVITKKSFKIVYMYDHFRGVTHKRSERFFLILSQSL